MDQLICKAVLRERPQFFVSLPSFSLIFRIAGLACLFALELIALSVWLDTAALRRSEGLTGLIGTQGPVLLSAIITAATLLVTFAALRDLRILNQISGEIEDAPFSWNFLAAHLGVMALFGLLSHFLFTASSSALQIDFLAAAWLLAGLMGIALGGCAFLPPRLWFQLAVVARGIWPYALGAGLIVYPITLYGRLLWKPTTALTFAAVRLLLYPFISNPVIDPIEHVIGSQSFYVAISRQCSGVEGAGLMLIFGVFWLLLFRKSCRFPQALLLVPAGVIAIWLLNALRLAMLILIGNAGAPNIALGGFHSQAGWISFNAVAVGFSVAARRLPWLAVYETQPALREKSAGDPNFLYLMPFAAILLAAMISRAASAQFEWLYPIRFFAAAAVLWWYRSDYRLFDWSFDWIAILTGGFVFAIWLALEPFSGSHAATNQFGPTLASAPLLGKLTWIAFRVLAAVFTVPVAEELVFRSFLLRRLVSAKFEAVSYRNITIVPILISSVAFGLLHDSRWLAGTVAGLLYSLAFLRRGKIGDAVAAHAITNALLAGYVMLWGQWSLW